MILTNAVVGGFVGALVAFYLACWLTAVIAFYSMYIDHGEYDDGTALLGAIFFGPLVFLVELPKFLKTIMTLASERLAELKNA